jgi:O-6-methylguanine DNA methyltransferase
VWVRVTLADVADMNHMPATGQCGFDCYLGAFGEQRFVGVTKYDHHKTEYKQCLFSVSERAMRHVTLIFPLYMGVKEVLVGVESDAELQAPLPYESDDRVVIYGTSITQGGCAARPGMATLNIISRRINREFINLGFSGSGRGEPEVARTIATIERSALFVMDYEANCGDVERMRATFPEFVRILRDAHPNVPILTFSRFIYATEFLDPEAYRMRLERKEIQRSHVEHLREAGDTNVHFVDGESFLGEPGTEGTVDGVHLQEPSGGTMSSRKRDVTDFQKKVYDATSRIPKGRVSTYALVAKAIRCGSARAVGQALRRNPFAPEVPCHRVIASDLSIGGFGGQTSGPRIRKKLGLLKREGVRFENGRLAEPARVYRFERKRRR